ncbi:beta-ketoacyl-[acyl-carrier-protein] synthase family protein [Nocardia crassostreae]|uniref:beta-ketoacyl-[acyl-carrier-protein] synthase family protein n=1 Tax=Nocardia crassostreae TaxID=53428 RepID=UPI00082AE4C3|nr:beta-ketoacyl-[acyl-carrier-protein] synthase family protein [Nocardia crassostreae]
MTRVAVTGLGPVSSIGIGRADFERNLFAGVVGTSEIESFDSSGFRTHRAGEVKRFAPGEICERVGERDFGRTALFAASAARLAVRDAGLSAAELAAARTTVCMGTTKGESRELERAAEQFYLSTPGRMSPEVTGRLAPAAITRAVRAEISGFTGPDYLFATACAASNYAIAFGALLIESGAADIVVAGGADSVVRWAHAAFFRVGALAPDVCRPFDADRQGILTAEGGVALVLESEPHARARGAEILGYVLGAGLNCDAEHVSAPDRDSIARCIRMAHRRAGVTPRDIDYVCAHGTGTQANDATEAAAILDVFGSQPPPVSSIKSMLGHTMGAAAGFGAVACVLALLRGQCPPTANLRRLDPAIGLPNVVAGTAQPAPLRVVQNHGFAFGGNNAIVVLGAA